MSNTTPPKTLHELDLALEANRLRQQQAAAALLAARRAQLGPSANLLASPVPSSLASLSNVAAGHAAPIALASNPSAVASVERNIQAQLANVAALQQRHQLASILATGANSPSPQTPTPTPTLTPSLPPFPAVSAASGTFGNALVRDERQATTAAILERALVHSRECAISPDVASVPSAAPTKKRRGGVSDPFPCKLHRILSEVERDGHSDIISWLLHGRAFVVRDSEKFVSEIMPKYFRMSSLSSLQRQLNLYNFKRISEGADKGAYYHRLFLRGQPDLAKDLRRTKTKSMYVTAMGPDGVPVCVPRGLASRYEPNFYDMPPLLDDSLSSDGHAPAQHPSCSSSSCGRGLTSSFLYR